MKRGCLPCAVVFLLAVPPLAMAAPITINFDNLADLDVVTTQYLGVTFTNALALEAGGSLNDFDFPPASGSFVVTNADDQFSPGDMAIDFAGTLPTSVSGLFTYTYPVTLTAYDAGLVVLGSATSLFSENFVSSGNAPNELLAFAFGGGIQRVVLSAGADGTFTLDDWTHELPDSVPIPEPGTLSLLIVGSVVAARRARRHCRERTRS